MNYQNDNYLSHHGVEGMKWGVRHDPERKGYGNRRHHNQKDQPQLSQREIAKRERTAYKKKKLPKTSLGLLLRNRNLSEAEYRQAKKKIERDRDVYEGFLRDIQNIQRTLDIPVNALNSGVKTVKNIDYINTLFGGTSFTDRKPSTRNNKWKKKFNSELKIVHSDMNIPSLVHSDTEDIDNFLCHYGVLGMKWGVHRAREHEKNIYRHNIANGMSRKDAKQEYRNRMSGVKQYAKANRKTGMKVPSEETRWKRSYDLEKNRLVNKAIQGIKNTGSSGTIDITELVKRRMGGLYHSDTITIPSLQHDDMKDVDNYLCHYGRKGMKWGQHIFGDTEETAKKYNYSSQEAERRLSNTDNFYNKYIRKKNVWIKPYNTAADRMEPYIKEINDLFKNKTLDVNSYFNNGYADKNTKEYLTKLQNKWESIYKEEIDKVYKNYADNNLTPDYYNTFPMMQSFYIDIGSKNPVKQARTTQHRYN